MSLIEDLQKQLADVEAKLEAHYRYQDGHSGAATNPAGEIGGIRSRSPKRKQQMFDRWMKDAKKGTALCEERDRLKRQIRIQTAHEKSAPAREKAEAALRDELPKFIKRGMFVWVTWSQVPLEVLRVNKKSVSVPLAGKPETVPFSQIGLQDEDRRRFVEELKAAGKL